MATALRISGVTVRRGSRAILDGVDWSVDSRERWIVMGPNGAGKTTLMLVAAARLHPTAGTVEILGETLGAVDVADLRTSIGWASGHERLPAGELVSDAVLTGAWSVSGRWREAYDSVDALRAARLCAEWGLVDVAARPVGTLSEGERKRMLIARALMSDPELLVLDEPAAGLDLGGRESLIRALTRAAAQTDGPAIVMVSHHLEEIPPGFTNGLLLRDGRVLAQGPLREVITDAWVSQAFGTELRVREHEGRWTVRPA